MPAGLQPKIKMIAAVGECYNGLIRMAKSDALPEAEGGRPDFRWQHSPRALITVLDWNAASEDGIVHRFEVISGSGRRQSFSDEFKSRVVEETPAPGAVVSRIARRHGLSPQQVFTWRRQAASVGRERGRGADFRSGHDRRAAGEP